jgi:hypothetical protein
MSGSEAILKDRRFPASAFQPISTTVSNEHGLNRCCKAVQLWRGFEFVYAIETDCPSRKSSL